VFVVLVVACVVVVQSKWTIIINCNKFHARIIYIQKHASVHRIIVLREVWAWQQVWVTFS